MDNKEKQGTDDVKEVKEQEPSNKESTETNQEIVRAGIPIGAFAVVLIFVLLVGIIVGYAFSIRGKSDNTDDKADKTQEAAKEEEPGEPYSGNPEEYVTLGEYTGIQVLVSPTDEDVQSAIEDVIDENTGDEQREGTVKSGDTVYCAFKATVDGKEFSDGTGEDYVEIGSGDWIPGFEEGITGMKTGEKKTLNLTFPAEYDDESVAGKAVTFEVEVKYICGEEIVPEYNDAFVQKISDCKNTAEYEEELKKNLRQENEDCKADLAWEQVVANATVNKYPGDMVELSTKIIRQGYQDMADMSGTTIEDIMTQWDTTEEDFTQMAKEEVNEFLIALAIAKKENITLSDDEYQSALEEDYSYYEESYDSMEAFEKEMGNYVRYEATVSKVTEWIGDSAVIAD